MNALNINVKNTKNKIIYVLTKDRHKKLTMCIVNCVLTGCLNKNVAPTYFGYLNTA